MKQFARRIPFAMTAAAVISAATVVLYWRYLSGQNVYILPHIVSDSINQFYPAYIDAARNFTKYRTMDFYSFAAGFGLHRQYTSPFFMMIFMFGEEYVPYMMGLKVALCVFLCGWLMGLFLREAGCETSACLFGGLAYAFSMQVVIVGSYHFQGELALMAALTLYGLEKCFHKKKSGVLLLVLSIVLGYLSLIFYYYLVYGGAAFVYVIVRMLYLNDGWEKISFRKKAVLLSGAMILAVLGLLILFPKMEGIFASNRFQTGLSEWGEQWKSTFTRNNALAILNCGYRTIAPNILGVFNIEQEFGYPFRTGGEDSGFYVGLLVLQLLPLLTTLKKNRKIILISSVLLTFLGILICVPGVRVLVNGFSGTNFKLNRLLGSMILVGIASYVWNEIIGKSKKINLVPVFVFDSIVALGILVPLLLRKNYLYPWDAVCVLAFLALYTVVLAVWNAREKRRSALKAVLLVLFAAELLLLNYRYVNNEEALTEDELANGYYNDGTAEAIQEICKSEEEGVFYRVNKAYESLLYSDAEVQGYYGTAFYRGGADDKYMSDFIMSFSVPTKSNMLGLCTGTYGYPALSAICSVRYGISHNEYMELGYQHIGQIGDKNLYANTAALPAVFVYHDMLSEEEMASFTVKQRHDLLLQACVLGEEDIDLFRGIDGLADSDRDFNRTVPVREYHYTNYEIGTEINIEPIESDEILVVSLANNKPAGLYLYWSTAEGGWNSRDFRLVSIYDRNQETFVEIANQEEIYGLIFYCLEDIHTIEEVSLYVYPREEYMAFSESRINVLKQDSAELYEIGENALAGEIVVDKPGLMHISIPYDAPYAYYLNGELCDTVRINYIFTGIFVEKGIYSLEVRKK